MTVKNESLWSHKQASESYDVIIIGGGLSGLGVAGLLAKSGKKVALLESG